MAQLGDLGDGIHEVTGSIPVSSTNSSNNSARPGRRPRTVASPVSFPELRPGGPSERRSLKYGNMGP